MKIKCIEPLCRKRNRSIYIYIYNDDADDDDDIIAGGNGFLPECQL